MAYKEHIGLALSGGGFKGFAEIAALEQLDAAGIPISAVAGTSAGSVLAALYAAGLPLEDIKQLCAQAEQRVVESGVFKKLPLRMWNFKKVQGMVPSEFLLGELQHLLEQAGIRGFEDLVLPIAIPSVELGTGELVVFTNAPELFASDKNAWKCMSGDLDLAMCLLASCSYPFAIAPAEYKGSTFIDGGVRMNLPTPLFNRRHFDGVVAFAMQMPLSYKDPKEMGLVDVVTRTVMCAGTQLDSMYATQADVFVNTPLRGVSSFDAGVGDQVLNEARLHLSRHPIDWSPLEKPKEGFFARLKNWAS